MRIEEIMTRDVATARTEQTGSDAARIMWEHDCGSVPIVDGDGYVVGIVTDRDLCMAAYTRGLPLEAIGLATVMSRAVSTCATADSVETVERLMQERQIRRVPVVGELGHLVGIVSLGDIARARQASPLGRVADHVLSDVSRTLAIVSTPRNGRPAPSTTVL